jgi:hypothetical protein
VNRVLKITLQQAAGSALAIAVQAKANKKSGPAMGRGAIAKFVWNRDTGGW